MTLEQDLAKARKRLRDVEAEQERFELEAKIALPGGFILMILAVILIVASGSNVFGILTVMAFLWWMKIGYFSGEGDRRSRKAAINAEINSLTSKKRQKTQRNRKAKQREKELKKREQELEGAKRLVKEGGIENLNRAIGIFEKYG
jgi:hypothetical protein